MGAQTKISLKSHGKIRGGGRKNSLCNFFATVAIIDLQAFPRTQLGVSTSSGNTIVEEHKFSDVKVQDIRSRISIRSMSIEVDAQSQTIGNYIRNSLSENSQTAFKSDMEHFRKWGGDIPCKPETVAAYLSDHAEALSVATLQRRLSSISKAHNLGEHENPTKSEIVRMCFRGIKRLHGRPQKRVSPITKEDLIAMLVHISAGNKGIRDKALLLTGFCGALRRSELCAISFEDLEFVPDGIKLTIPRSKTDQTGQGHIIGIPYGKGRVCPVEAMKEWLGTSGVDSGPIFRSVNKGGGIGQTAISSRAVANIIKEYAEKLGMNPDKYSGHSLRSGLCSSAAQHGVSSWVIRKTTGHKSDNMLNRYIREGSLFKDNAAASLF